MLVIKLEPNETITAEAGAMTYMEPAINVKTRKRERSILGTLGLKILGGQSFFVNDYNTKTTPAEVAFVSAPVGDIEVLDIKPNQGYIIQSSSYIASTQNVELDIKWQGFTKGLFGQGLFMIKVSGEGKLFINTFGAIDKHTIEAGKSLIVDNFHLVAFSDKCDYKVKKFGGLKSTILGGEGLVTEISGPGDIYIQTKNLREFAEWLWAILRSKVQSRAR